MSSINKRAFGAAIPADVIRKLKIAEEKGAGVGVHDSQAGMDVTDITSDSFRGNGYYSSKTPFARMWTAVSVVGKTDKVTDTENPTLANLEDIDLKKFRYEMVPGEKSILRATEIDRTPKDALGKIYTLGTYNLTGDRKIYEPAGGDNFDPNTILASQRETYTDEDYAANPNTRRLRPPAGITSVRSSTRGGSNGPLQGVLKTKVSFVVYDFEEFDQIYSRYFLRPGAQIFVDFGWTHKKNFSLYNPEDLLKEEETEQGKYMEKIYGKVKEDGTVEKNGQVHDCDYDVQFVRGLVTNCRADLDPGSLSWNCELEILSHNVALANPTLVEDTLVGKAKENILSNLDYRIIVLAAEALFPEYFKDDAGGEGLKLFPNSKFSTDEAKIYNKVADDFANNFLGNPDRNVPKQLNVELGIYWRGNYKKGDEGEKTPSTTPGSIYVSWGWFEDVILNKEFGKGGTFDVENFDLLGVKNNDDIVFKTSIESRTYYSEKLWRRQTFMGEKYRDLPFLFPENWDKTYNTQNTANPGSWEDLTGTYKTAKKIPIREIFIKLDLLKTALREAETLDEFFTYLTRKMADATGNNWKWEKQASDPLNNTLGLVDVLADARTNEDFEGNPLELAERITAAQNPEFYDNLYEFNPGSPQSLVKNMSLNMSYGGSDLISSQVALSGLGSTGNSILPVSDLIDQAQSMEIINNMGDREGKTADYEVEFVPQHNISELERIIKKNIAKSISGNPNPGANEVKDTAYLSRGSIYGPYSFSIEQNETTTKKIDNLASKTSNLKENNATDLTPASVIPTDEFKKAKNELIAKGFVYSSDIFDFFTDTYIVENLRTKPTIMNFEINLQLYGINAFVIGDIFNIGLLPKRIRNAVYFQIYNIDHSISPGDYTTTLGCKMLLRPDIKKLAYGTSDINTPVNTGYVMEPKALQSDFKLPGIQKVLPFLLWIRPWTSSNVQDLKGIEYLFEVKTFKSGKSEFIFDLFESFELTSEENKEKSIEYRHKLLDSGVFSGTPATLDEDADEKTSSAKKQYSFEKDKSYFIFMKKNKWIITDSGDLERPNAFFDVLFPPPAETT